MEHGSLYPALHRLERKNWVVAKWQTPNKDVKREFKDYRLTPAGKKQLLAEESKRKHMTGAIARIMWPAEESCHAVAGRELRDRLDLETEEQRQGGLPLDHAPFAARRQFGNTALHLSHSKRMSPVGYL